MERRENLEKEIEKPLTLLGRPLPSFPLLGPASPNSRAQPTNQSVLAPPPTSRASCVVCRTPPRRAPRPPPPARLHPSRHRRNLRLPRQTIALPDATSPEPSLPLLLPPRSATSMALCPRTRPALRFRLAGAAALVAMRRSAPRTLQGPYPLLAGP